MALPLASPQSYLLLAERFRVHVNVFTQVGFRVRLASVVL